MTSFGRRFDLHDVIYHIPPCNFDNRQGNFILQQLDVQNVLKNTLFSPNKSYWKFYQYQSVQDGGIVIDSEDFVHIFNLFVC